MNYARATAYRWRRMAPQALLGLGLAGWALFAFITAYAIGLGWQYTTGDVRQVDWHVYLAGARDLLGRELYRVPLELGGLRLSTPEYNLPPLSATLPIPLMPWPIAVGGNIWQAVNAASVAVAAAVAAAVADTRRWLAWAGVGLGSLSFTLFYLEGLHLGTNNYLLLGIVAGFTWCYLRGAWRAAGLLLGFGIALKIWPVTLVVLLLRGRRWGMLAIAGALVALQAIVFITWLGLGMPAAMIDAMRVQIPATGLLIGPTAVEWLRPAWNSGLGFAAAGFLLLIPARGRAGIGLAILAGLSPIANLWIHYAPTVLFALVLLGAEVWERWSPFTKS